MSEQSIDLSDDAAWFAQFPAPRMVPCNFRLPPAEDHSEHASIRSIRTLRWTPPERLPDESEDAHGLRVVADLEAKTEYRR